MATSLRIFAAAALLCACGGGTDEITLSTTSAKLPVGGHLQLTATPGDVAWSSSSLAIVTIDDTGLVTAVARGVAIVTAEAGGARATARIAVTDGGVVDAAGGAVTALDGVVTVEVPAGAVAAETPISVSAPAFDLLDARLVPGTMATLEGFTLAAPASLRVRVTADQAPLGLPRAWLRLVRRDGDTWSELDSADDGAETSAMITTPGTYAVRVAESPATCDAPAHRQFDFWLGQWTIFAPGGTTNIGSSTISRDAGGCLIMEAYQPAGVGSGRSVSFYNPDTGRWYQTYYFLAGSPPLRMAGGLDGTRMVLITPEGLQRTRFTWQRNDDGSVRQYSQFSADGGATWALGFDGTYR